MSIFDKHTKRKAEPDFFVDFATKYNGDLVTEANVAGNSFKKVAEAPKRFILDKLYELIGNKISKLDPEYKEIEKSAGDIKRYKYYKILGDTVLSLKKLVAEAKNTPAAASLDMIFECWDNINSSTKIFTESYKYDNGLLKHLYVAVVGSVIHALGYVTTVMVKYETRKLGGMSGKEVYVSILDAENSAYKCMPESIINTILQFNTHCKGGELQKFHDAYKKKPEIKHEDFLFSALGLLIIGAGIWYIPSIIRYCVYFFMHSKLKLSEYIQAQADHLEFQALKLRRNDGDANVIKRELEFVDRLRAFAAKLSGNTYAAEKSSKEEIEAENRQIAKDAEKSPPETTVPDNRGNTQDDDIFI